MNKNRIIFHIDLDAFFASCEERENPRFKGKPIIVGADPRGGKGRGVVSTANYKAREFGIHSAMPISRAFRLCPDGIFLPVNGTLYSRVSKSVMDILESTAQKYSGKFEQVGIDEAYLDLSDYLLHGLQNFDDRLSFVIAGKIKKEIYNRDKITASVGVAPNMLVAKIASDFNKPGGLTIIKPDQVQKFLNPMGIRKLPGIGQKTESALNKLNIKIIADLIKIPQSILYEKFGEHGISLYNSARGIDDRVVTREQETKSISEEHTFMRDVDSAQEILPVLFSLVKNVLGAASLENRQNFKTITVKIRYSDFKTHTKSLSGSYNLYNPDHIEKTALKLLWPFINGTPRTTSNSMRGSVFSGQIKNLEKKRKKIRLIGFRVSRFNKKTA